MTWPGSRLSVAVGDEGDEGGEGAAAPVIGVSTLLEGAARGITCSAVVDVVMGGAS